MEKKSILLSALAATALFSATAAKNTADPVVMTIGGKEIHQSEFDYLYQKNNLQQLTPQTLDEYIDMFVVYKLKVAEAEAAGIDKTDSFRKEFDGYCVELSKPYLRDSLVTKRLIDEAYSRMKTMRLVSHIILPLGDTYDEDVANRNRLDSIRNEIVNGRADFAEMALKYSQDKSVSRNNGSMGYVSPNRFPYPFEYAAYNTPVGEISQVVDDTPYGYHIIRVEDECPNPGKVVARHILKLTRGLSTEDAAAKKAQIDSIHTLLLNGGDFDAIARAESEDPGSARNGGKLRPFGRGEMVKEFEQTSFSLKEGEISAPFETAYGYHIVQTLAFQPIGTLEEELPGIKSAIDRDMRATFPEKERLQTFKETFGVNIDTDALMNIKSIMDSAPDVLSAYTSADAAAVPFAVVAGKTITSADICATIPESLRKESTDAFLVFNNRMKQFIDDETTIAARKHLMDENIEYRNIVNEYRDGMLLFEISNKNIWERSTTDTDGLKKYFEKNRSNYSWDAPHYKGFVIFATSDSIADAAKSYLATATISHDSIANELQANFGRNIKVEKVVTGKGENQIVDNIAFGADKPQAPGKWASWFGYAGRIIDSPEEANDVKSAITTDYQQELERSWVDTLKKKYKVKIDRKQIKKSQNS